MPINCHVILQPAATPEQLTALGTALWHWCRRAAEDTGTHHYLDNQALAHLIAGRPPESSQPQPRAERWCAHFWVRDESSRDRQATIDTLRKDIPAEGVEDIVVDGISWRPAGSRDRTCATLQ
jgi:hypothetical protein